MNLSPVYHNSRPDGELLPQEAAAFDLLDRLGIEYDRVSHDAAFNMELCAEVGRALDVSVCKNLFLCNRQKTQFYLLCMMPDKPFHTKDLSAQIHSARLSFAPEELLWELLHCTPGSATVLGLANDMERRVQLLIDREVYNAPYFSCHPCICTSTLRPIQCLPTAGTVFLHFASKTIAIGNVIGYTHRIPTATAHSTSCAAAAKEKENEPLWLAVRQRGDLS